VTSFLRCFLRCVCVYSLADSEEKTPSERALSGQDKERVLKLSRPSTAEYRMVNFFFRKNAPSDGQGNPWPGAVLGATCEPGVILDEITTH